GRGRVGSVDGGQVLGGERHWAAVGVGDGSAAGGDEVVEPRFAVGRNDKRERRNGGGWGADGDEAEEGFVQFFRIAGIGAGFVDDAVYGVGVEGAEVAGVLGKRAAEGDGAGASLLERGVVEVGVRLRVEHLVGEGGGLGRVLGVEADFACFYAVEDVLQTVDVHRLVHTIVDGLADDGVVRDLDGA